MAGNKKIDKERFRYEVANEIALDIQKKRKKKANGNQQTGRQQ